MSPAKLPRNDVRQYAQLAEEWDRPNGAFAALHWLADARALLVPAAEDDDRVLVDIGCGGGLMADRVHGYYYVGLDLAPSALVVAQHRGVKAVQADATRLPLRTDSADVVVAGEILEHVEDIDSLVAEIARILRPDGLVVFDTISDTWWARFSLVTVGERMPGGPPRNIHDPDLFVSPRRLEALFERNGLHVSMFGLRPSVRDYMWFLIRRRGTVQMLRTGSLAGVYQGVASRRS